MTTEDILLAKIEKLEKTVVDRDRSINLLEVDRDRSVHLLEGEVSDLQRRVNELEGAEPDAELLEQLRDFGNWQDGKWKPVLGYVEPDIHRFMDRVFGEGA